MSKAKKSSKVPMQLKRNYVDVPDTRDEDHFLFNTYQDEQEAVKVVFGSTKNDYEQKHWYSHG